MSNRDRIARKAEEALLAEAEKVAKRAASKTTERRSKRATKSVRMKVVWEVCSATGKTVQTFPYPDKAAAEGAAQVLTRSTGHAHILRAAKVPMD